LRFRFTFSLLFRARSIKQFGRDMNQSWMSRSSEGSGGDVSCARDTSRMKVVRGTGRKGRRIGRALRPDDGSGPAVSSITSPTGARHAPRINRHHPNLDTASALAHSVPQTQVSHQSPTACPITATHHALQKAHDYPLYKVDYMDKREF